MQRLQPASVPTTELRRDDLSPMPKGSQVMVYRKTAHANAKKSVNVIALATEHRGPAAATFEFWDEDGRRHLVAFDASRIDALISQLTYVQQTLNRQESNS